MKKIKKLFSKNLLFRYITTFLGILLVVSLLLIIEKSIPNTRVKENILKSEGYYQKYFKDLYGNIDNIKNGHTKIDIPGDFYHLSILYLEENKHPVREFIEMNKDSQLAVKIRDGGHFTDIETDSDYSRYWHGHLIVLKPLLSFFTMGTIFNIYLVILAITFCILLINLLKHSKLLAVIFTLGAVSINLFFASKCDNFFYVFMITMVSSIIIIKMYENKSKNVDLLFLTNGVLTACFDMLSGGTLPVTIPLFIYVYLHILDGKKFKFRLLVRYILLWLLGGILSYVVKWIILLIHYNGGFKEHVLEPMKVRISAGDQGRVAIFMSSIYEVLHFVFPYDLQTLKFIFIGLGLISFIYVLNDKKNRNNYLYLLIICLIPFIRYFFLAEHSNYHNYFTYRAFLPNIMFILLFISLAVIKLKKDIIVKRKA